MDYSSRITAMNRSPSNEDRFALLLEWEYHSCRGVPRPTGETHRATGYLFFVPFVPSCFIPLLHL